MSYDAAILRLEKMRRDLEALTKQFADARSKRRDVEIEKMSDAEIDFECFCDDADRLGIPRPTGPDDEAGFARIRKEIRDRNPRRRR